MAARPLRPPTSRAVILHPILRRPPVTLPSASFLDVPLDILRLVAAELAESGTARDVAVFESVCTVTRCVCACMKRNLDGRAKVCREGSGGRGPPA